MISEFKGFHEETLKFLVELKLNNSKEWFDSNRERYDKYVLEPSKAFVNDLGKRLREISPEIIAEPKVNRSLFRLNRDVRFSPNKTPYKTHIGIIIWEGPRKRMESSGFYTQIDTETIMFAGGMYLIPKDLLDSYRMIVSHEGPAKELADAVMKIEETGIDVEGEHYKKIPGNHSADHDNSHFLKYNGVYGMETMEIPDEFFDSELIDIAFERFSRMEPLHRWFLKYLY